VILSHEQTKNTERGGDESFVELCIGILKWLYKYLQGLGNIIATHYVNKFKYMYEKYHGQYMLNM